MTFKYIISITIFLIHYLSLSCQTNNDKINKGIIYYDVDSIPVFEVYKNENMTNIYYFHQKIVSEDIQFKGGYKALYALCDSLYYNRNDYNDIELNARAIYSILFDKNLRIKDVRIIKRYAYDNEKYNYDDLIKRIMFSTEGKWYRSNDTICNEYFYLGLFYLR